MGISITGGDSISKKLSDVANAYHDSVLIERVGFKAIDLIETRTATGKGVNGRAFKPYSQGYAKAITSGKKGVTQKQSKIVTLEATGAMLRNMTNLVEGSKAIIIFPDQEQNIKAFAHHTGSRMPQRKFFAMSKTDMTAIDLVIENYYKAKING